MKRAIMVGAGCSLVSVMVPVEMKPLLLVGLRLKTTRELDLSPYATVAPGELGTVTAVDADTGVVEVELDAYHAGLGYWHNCVTLVPFETDDILCGITLECGCVLKVAC